MRRAFFLLLLLLLLLAVAQVSSSDPSCAADFREGKADFFLDTSDSINAGAALLAGFNAMDCVAACCDHPRCSVALSDLRDAAGGCFLFDCLYKERFVCNFARKEGFVSYVKASVYARFLDGPTAGEKDRPPVADAGPAVVAQPMESVTLNGVESWDDKKIARYDWSLVQGNQSVVMEKTGYEDQVMVSNLFPGVYVFQLKVTDSHDQSATAEVQVLVLTHQQSEHHCLVPKKTGPCKGSFTRWHYNAASEKCESFVFGGCKANLNNYLSEKECIAACNGISASSFRRSGVPEHEACGATCRDDQFTCKPGCCVDDSLECDGVAHCSNGADESGCSMINRTLSRLLHIHVDEDKAHCTEPPVTGPCRASMSHWYYDPMDRRCYRFTYGGCDGNKNNFEQERVCMDTCKLVTDKDVFAKGLFDRSPPGDPKSGSIAALVLLLVAVFAALAVIGYCVLKKRKRADHQPVATSPPQIQLQEDSDNMVYNSTTKPV
ncbi:kunitz-type protease inhibitor 1-like [Denticeps clupeoides]|uniref:kunitz-type protease inhibitor 1-like n=1 Tax=Denticeps clupeoides TaxID=299321 RepID=UPI0010A50E6E|nr:kunitz-type protease inhibitor 1-like [Denticeps clupeoides]